LLLDVTVLADHGIKSIVLVADHGHLFADEIGEDMKIEAPGGKVEDLHRRVWVYRGLKGYERRDSGHAVLEMLEGFSPRRTFPP
jgi:hypothetical protein